MLPVRLYLPPPRTPLLPGAQLDQFLHYDLGGPPAGGVFVADRHLARQAFVNHQVAAVDPIDTEFAMVSWWSMRPDLEDAQVYRGPLLFFDTSTYTPTLPEGGLPVASALRLYLDATGVSLKMPDRIALRQHRHEPRQLVRRLVQMPAGLRNRDLFEARLRMLPSPRSLWLWQKRMREAFWQSHAIYRFLADLASEAIVAFQGNGEEAPASYFESDVQFDPALGAIFLKSDFRIPIRSGLHCFRLGDIPPKALALRQARYEIGMRGARTLKVRAKQAQAKQAQSQAAAA
jgi:hypothetical protein